LTQPANNWDPNGNGWDAQSRLTIGGTNVTLAGQTAPGSGVIFMGGGLKPQGNGNIIRNITVASGYGLQGWWSPGNPMPGVPGTAGASSDPAQWFPDNTVFDAMDISGTNIMIDHVSTIYATDETISMNEVAKNITVQYSNISQGQNYPQWDAEGGGLTGHALGSLLEAGNTTSAAISFHHNLYAHLKGRTPQMQAGQTGGGYYDFRNNVFYNWFGTAGSRSGTTFVNLVNNFYLAGDGGDNPTGGNNPGIGTSSGGTGVLSASSNVYRNGNVLDSNKDADANDGVAVSNGGPASPLWVGGVNTYAGVTDTATQTFDRVLNYVGANWWTRDAVINTPDERIINEARTGNGKVIAWADDPWNNDPAEGVEWRMLKNTPQTNRAADWDTEASVGYGVGDGMPSWWELDHGLNPDARDDAGDFDSDGYTNLEEYLNEIAAWPAPQPIVFTGATNARYAQITNWDIKWQPSKYDTARITNGATVHVDAVGQHAGVLQVGEGGPGVLALDSGWVRVHQLLRVRETGVVQFNGGAVDLTSAAGIFDYSTTSPLSELTVQLQSGRNGGAWNGPGIHSSAAAAMPGTGIGIVEASDLGVTTFAGQPVDSTTVLMRWTFEGDTDLNGMVDVADLGRLASHWQSEGDWFDGDFDYNGTIDVNDLGMLASNWQAGVGNPLGPSLSEALVALGLPTNTVPEPTLISALWVIPWSLKRGGRAARSARLTTFVAQNFHSCSQPGGGISTFDQHRQGDRRRRRRKFNRRISTVCSRCNLHAVQVDL
jgi:hypothetical protein